MPKAKPSAPTLVLPADATVMLLDTYGLVYRAFFALPPLTTTKGVAINAAYGFTQMLHKIVADEKPTHLIACFDKGMPQARVDLFPENKSHRDEMPGDLRPQFGLVRRILTDMNIPIVEEAGQEADDVIATLARQATEAGAKTLIVTGDLDLLQTVRDGVTALVTRRGITDMNRYDRAAVFERFELEPEQLPDYRGLKGDPSDNLPGIPGVGEKTATKLIKAAGTLDALVANPALAGTPKLQKLVEQYGAQAQTCRDVSVIRSDLDVVIDWEHSRFHPAPVEVLYKLYRELEFKTLLNKLHVPEELPLSSAEETLQGSWESLGMDPDRLKERLHSLGSRVALALRGDELGFSDRAGTGFSAPLSVLDLSALWASDRELVMYDCKPLLRRFGARPVADDPMIAAHLLNPSRAFGLLADAASEFLDRVVPEDPAAYADAALQLAAALPAKLEERGQTRLYRELELPLAAILADMERAGIAVDPTELGVMGTEIDSTMARLEAEIYELAGHPVNLGSPQQLGALLFEELKLPGGKKNKTGWATGVEILQGLAREHRICALILEFREVAKLKNTYVDVIPKLTDADGRLRTVFHQTVTATGRLSSSNPNLQNIPVRGELGRRIRRAFVAPPGKRLMAADYSQIELRLMAHLSQDDAMLSAFNSRQDIHDFTARKIFQVPEGTEIEPNQRRMAKSVNFGLLYGMSDFGLAQRLEIGRAEAKEMTVAYFARFPSVQDFIHSVVEKGRDDGYVSTISGRRRYMPALRSSNYMPRSAAEREATNAPIQGSAADMMKQAMVRIQKALPSSGLDARMLLQIHDELIFEVAEADVTPLAALVRREMEAALPLTVPVEATVKLGSSWFDVAALEEEVLA